MEQLGANVSQLTLAMRQRRRSSVLGRMSVGVAQTAVEIPLGEDSHDASDDDDVLYRRSDSKTKVQISDFDRLCVLGQGAYGKVMLVKFRRDGRLFAQKELKKASVVVTAKSIERTLSERTILSRLTRHPNIVKLFYALHDDTKLYLLMEFIPGGELFQYLAKERFMNERKASFYVAQMAMALKHLHKCGVIYRDLKPENCMLDASGYLVLTDFGLAKQGERSDAKDMEHNELEDSSGSSTATCDLNSSARFKSIIGTPEYCAPEVLAGRDYGFKADWWSLGCVTFDLLTGDPPFTGRTHLQITNRVLKDKPKYPPQVMPDSRQLMGKLLEKRADKRLDVDAEWTSFQKMGFFKYYKFADLEARRVDAPIKPDVGNPEDAQCFDEEFTAMRLDTSEEFGMNIPPTNMDTPAEPFKGFSFNANGSYMEAYMD